MHRPLLVLLAVLASVSHAAPELQFKDRWFNSRALSELKYKAVIVFLMDPTCPLVKRLVPLMNQLQEDIWRRKLDVLVLGAIHDPHESVQSVQEYAFRNQATFPVAQLVSGDLAALGLTRLGSAVLFGENKEVLYRGRVSDKIRFTGYVPDGRDHIREALEAYLAGRPISPAEVEGEGCAVELNPAEEPVSDVTWPDVAPIFARHCVACHRAGGGAPFALDTRLAAKRKANTILRVVSEDRMPPWFATRHTPHPFANENRLGDREKKLLRDWVRGGKPGTGDETLKTVVVDFPAPDRVFVSQELKVPATGIIPYANIPLLDSFSFRERWISAIRIVPTNPNVVHHANLAYVEGANLVGGVPSKNFISGYVPGIMPMVLEPGVGLKMPGWAMLGLQVHLVTTGAEETTRIRVEVKFANDVKRRLRFHMFDTLNLAIPPHHPHFPVREDWTAPRDIELIGAFAHMHYRGKDFHMTMEQDAKPATLLAIPNYQFDWQMGYQWPSGKIFAPEGTRFTVLSHFDNSRFNLYNPDPKATVKYGEQSNDEMMLGFLYYLLRHEDLGLEL